MQTEIAASLDTVFHALETNQLCTHGWTTHNGRRGLGAALRKHPVGRLWCHYKSPSWWPKRLETASSTPLQHSGQARSLASVNILHPAPDNTQLTRSLLVRHPLFRSTRHSFASEILLLTVKFQVRRNSERLRAICDAHILVNHPHLFDLRNHRYGEKQEWADLGKLAC